MLISFHFYCTVLGAEGSETDIAKAEQINTKVSDWKEERNVIL